MIKAVKTEKIPTLLLPWFKKHKRPLPWRKTLDPYKIWVSEIMLQQTQVNTVIPYYNRWMKNFPSLRKLGEAPLSRVLKMWEGLGYYSRARNLHQAAGLAMQKWKGGLPKSAEELRKLPGIGRYTAGAIASIAFNRPEPILDGNVKRVLSRIFAVREPVDQTRGEKRLWKIARELVGQSPFSPRDFNQSLMELGALVCLPENPKCSVCPLGKVCLAHRTGRETAFPVKGRREKSEKLRTVAAVIWKKGRVLLEKQPPRGRWGGLWMFPQWIYTSGKPEADFITERVKKELGFKIDQFRPKTEIEHGFTKYRVKLSVYEGRVAIRSRRGGVAPPLRTKWNQWSWTPPKNISELPLPSPHQKIAQEILHA